MADHTQGSGSVAKVTLAVASRLNIHQPPALIKPGANSHHSTGRRPQIDQTWLDFVLNLGGGRVEENIWEY